MFLLCPFETVYFAGFSSGSFHCWTIGLMTGAGNASMPSGDMPRLEPSEGWVRMGMVLPFLPESWLSGTTTISLKTLDFLSLVGF